MSSYWQVVTLHGEVGCLSGSNAIRFLILHGILQIKVGRKCIKSCTMNMNKLVDSVSDICKFIMHAKI